MFGVIILLEDEFLPIHAIPVHSLDEMIFQNLLIEELVHSSINPAHESHSIGYAAPNHNTSSPMLHCLLNMLLGMRSSLLFPHPGPSIRLDTINLDLIREYNTFPVLIGPMLVLLCKLLTLLEMANFKKRLRGLYNGTHILFLKCIPNGLVADMNPCHPLELRSSISLSRDNESNKMATIMGGEFGRMASRIMFERSSDLRANFSNSRRANIKLFGNLSTRVTILKHADNDAMGIE